MKSYKISFVTFFKCLNTVGQTTATVSLLVKSYHRKIVSYGWMKINNVIEIDDRRPVQDNISARKEPRTLVEDVVTKYGGIVMVGYDPSEIDIS